MSDQKTDDDQMHSGNPNMAVQKDAKPQMVRGSQAWRGNDKISDNNDHQESFPIPAPTRRS